MQHEILVRNAKKNTLIMFNLSVHLMVENFPCHIAYLSIVGVVWVCSWILTFWWVKKQNLFFLRPCIDMCTPIFQTFCRPCIDILSNTLILFDKQRSNWSFLLCVTYKPLLIKQNECMCRVIL